MKRFLALFLCLVMLVSISPVAYAADLEDEPALEQEDPAQLLEVPEEDPYELPEEPEYSVEEEDPAPAEPEYSVEEEDPAEPEYSVEEEDPAPAEEPIMEEVEEGLFHVYWPEGENTLDGVYNDDFPAVLSFSIDEDVQLLSVGDTVHFHARFSDDQGISSATIYFQTKQTNYNSVFLREAGDEWVGEYTFADNDLPGEYRVWSADISDTAGHRSYYNSNSRRVMERYFPGCVYLAGEGGEQPGAVSNLTLDQKGQTLSPGDAVTLSFDLPAGTEISNINVSFSRSGYTGSFSLNYRSWGEDNTLSYDKETGHVSGSYTLTDDMTNGVWFISSIYASGSGTTIQGSYHMDNLFFTLAGAAEPAAGPKVESVSCDKDGKVVTDGETVSFSVKLSGTKPGSVSISMNEVVPASSNYSYGSGINESGASIRVSCAYNEGSGLYEGSYTFKESDTYGVYSVSVNVGSRYQQTDILVQFATSGASSVKRLGKATNLSFKNGIAKFTLPANHIGAFILRYCSAADDSTVNQISYRPNPGVDFSWTQTSGADFFLRSQGLSAGDYYFTVTVLGDGTSCYDGLSAKSPIFTYTVPAKHLGAVTNLGWDAENRLATYQAPADEYLGGVEVQWYFSEKASGAPEFAGMTSHIGPEAAGAVIPDAVLSTYGSGYYSFRARAITNNILEALNGDWSDYSPAFHTESQAAATVSALDEILESGKTGSEVRDAVQELDTEELRLAMLTDEGVVDKLRELEAHAGSRTVVEVSKPELSGASAVGAGLNSLGGDVTLSVGQPQREHVLDAMYDNTLALQFSMGLNNVADDNSLKVPVQVTLPIPAGISPDALMILHYPDDGGDPTPVGFQIFQAGNRWYAQLVLTSFSDFVMTQTARPKQAEIPEYLLLTKGESYDFSPIAELMGYTFHSDECNIVDKNGDPSDVVSISNNNGTLVLVADKAGTAFATVQYYVELDELQTAFLRIDVVDDVDEDDEPLPNPLAAAVDKVRLLDAKTTVELFKTDYSVLPLMLEREALSGTDAANNPLLPEDTIPELVETGAAIESARFTDPAVAILFDLKVVDDHSLAIVPKYSTLEMAQAKASNVKGSYKSGIEVVVDGVPFPVVGLNGKDAVLTMAVKQSMPKLKVGALKLNSVLVRETSESYLENKGYDVLISPLSFTGGTLTDLAPDFEAAAKAKKDAIPNWMLLCQTEDGFGVLPNRDTMPLKGSGKLYLLATLDGWAIQVPVVASYSVTATYPSISFKPATVTVNPFYGDAATLSYTIKGAGFEDESRFNATLRITEGSNEYAMGEVLTLGPPLDNSMKNAFSIAPVSDAEVFQDGKAHTFKVYLGLAGKEFPFTVKTVASSAEPTLSVKASGVIDTGMPESYITLRPTAKNYSIASGSCLAVRFLKVNAKDKYDVEDITEEGIFQTEVPPDEYWPKYPFAIVYMEEYDSRLIEKGYNYYAEIQLEEGGTPISRPVRVKLNVKTTDPDTIKPTVSLKVSGSLDVLQQITWPDYDRIIVTVTVKNAYSYSLKKSDLVFYKTVGGEKTEVTQDELPFRIGEVQHDQDRDYVEIWFYRGSNSSKWFDTAKEKFSVAVRPGTIDGHKVAESKAVTLNFKQGSAKVQAPAPVTLVSTDKLSRDVVTIKPVREDYAIDRAELDAAGAALFKLERPKTNEEQWAEGFEDQWVLSYKDNVLPAGLKPGSTKSVKINLFFAGNGGSKPNATVTLKVNIK